jgi:pimeloyl-ACP methyl ester carboxylesterase
MPGARLAHAATVIAADGTKLFHEVTGDGRPIIFLHQTARAYRSFDLQVAALKDSFQCIAYNARGNPPSDVPGSLASYSQDIAAADVKAVLDARRLRDAHIVGVSMGSAVALQLALRNGGRVRSLMLCSIGAGSDLKPGEFAANVEATAAKIEVDEGSKLGDVLGSPPDLNGSSRKGPLSLKNSLIKRPVSRPSD